MSSFRTHPEAAEELDDQLAYLKARTLWAASKFADAYAAALTKIQSHPASGHFVWRQFRRYNIPGQSHAVIYREEADAIYVIAVMHEKRHPDYWKERIDEDETVL
jgi:plasmid stabilization system protein ParE